MVMAQISNCKNLKRFCVRNLNASLKTNLDILNSALGRQSLLEGLSIEFVVPEG
jgi:hypothetical protein